MTQTKIRKTSLDFVKYDPRYDRAAMNAVDVCLRVVPGEHTTLITDMATLPIAASLAKELRAVGAELRTYVLEDYAERPLQHMPPEILEDLANSQVSIY